MLPPEDFSSGERQDFENGWQLLMEGDLAGAASHLEKLSRKYPNNPDVASARGFLELRAGDRGTADAFFELALHEAPGFLVAQEGYVLSALARNDDDLAFARLTDLRAQHPSSELVTRDYMTLRIRIAESRLRHARALLREKKFAEAADAYAETLKVAPEAGSLYLEAAEADLLAGRTDMALAHAERAVELEPDSPASLRVVAEARYKDGDLDGALDAYAGVVALRPDDTEARTRFQELRREYDETNRPAEYERIAEATRLTREQLAALLFLELRGSFAAEGFGVSEHTRVKVIATDIANSWASEAIVQVVGAGILEVFPNHTFLPNAFVNRADFSKALWSALSELAPATFEAAQQSIRFDQVFEDLPSANVYYQPAALAVSLGLLSLVESDEFEPNRWVTGEEALEAVQTLAAHMTL